MPEPQPHPRTPAIRRVAVIALIVGVLIMFLKLAIFWLTGSAAVLSDALESIINIVAAAAMIFSIWFSSRPADSDHPYGHGKVEFMTQAFEGAMVLSAGIAVGSVAIIRLMAPIELSHLDRGAWGLGGVNLLNAALAGFVYFAGRRFGSPVLVADGKHLLTDVASTFGALGGLLLVHWTGIVWLDPVVALLLCAMILYTAATILREAIDGLMDRIDPADQSLILRILDQEVNRGAIRSYHKVRHRHTGTFHWVDMHLQVDGDMSVRAGHDLASRIEGQIEQALGQANVTAHIEPEEAARGIGQMKGSQL
ncbi:MAG: cation diffusion facilitator family transporter [Phycisphaeraceae bacterium]